MCEAQARPAADAAAVPTHGSCSEQGFRYRRRFAGLPSQVKHARRFVSRCLGDRPAGETAVLLTSELVTNALTHSASGAPGGKFDVTVLVGHDRTRIEVGDRGADSRPEPQHREPFDISEHGRGLDLVAALALRWGCTDRPNGTGRVVWFELAEDADAEQAIEPASDRQ
jgi:anti-sigma regulatory factor (Ser/Thr protein kinase)